MSTTELKILVVSLLGSVLLTQLAAQTASPVALIAGVGSFAWQRTDRYVAPDFESFFPDDPDGAKHLDALWKGPNKESLAPDQVLPVVRAGLRRYRGDRAACIAWIGRFVWNAKPQDPAAIEIMYHAADFRREKNNRYGVRFQAVYHGLSVVFPKTPAILRTLADKIRGRPHPRGTSSGSPPDGGDDPSVWREPDCHPHRGRCHTLVFREPLAAASRGEGHYPR